MGLKSPFSLEFNGKLTQSIEFLLLLCKFVFKMFQRVSKTKFKNKNSCVKQNTFQHIIQIIYIVTFVSNQDLRFNQYTSATPAVTGGSRTLERAHAPITSCGQRHMGGGDVTAARGVCLPGRRGAGQSVEVWGVGRVRGHRCLFLCIVFIFVCFLGAFCVRSLLGGNVRGVSSRCVFTEESKTYKRKELSGFNVKV